jgi:hypothetical protein
VIAAVLGILSRLQMLETSFRIPQPLEGNMHTMDKWHPG